MVLELAQENIWCNKWRYDDAEKTYYEAYYGAVTPVCILFLQLFFMS